MSKFTKQHYEAIARTMQDVRAQLDAFRGEDFATSKEYWTGVETYRDACRRLADTFASDNPAFNRERFLNACVPGANVKARKVAA